MKWIVQLDYEFGEFEPNAIYFRRVYSNDIEYSSAYDTKREALEAFCHGQFAIDQLRKEREAEQKEAEQKKAEGWDKAIKEAKEKYGYGKLEERIDVIRDFSPRQEAEQKKEEPKPIDYSRYCKTAMFDPNEPTIDERLAKIEERLTEIEGVLSSIGSPDYDLRKKVEELEKKHRRLFKDYKTHLCVNHNYAMAQKDMELIMQYEPEE